LNQKQSLKATVDDMRKKKKSAENDRGEWWRRMVVRVRPYEFERV
jgi:hypothetical protein